MSVDDLMMRLAGRGYGWYLALKVMKAASLPVFVSGWLVYAAVLGLFLAIGGAIVAAKEAAVFIIGDFCENVLRKKWFTGFGRAYYGSLSHYNKRGPYKPLPSVDVDGGNDGG